MLLGIGGGIWALGSALYGNCTDDRLAQDFFCMTIVGFNLYVIAIVIYVACLTGVKIKGYGLMVGLGILTSLVDGVSFGSMRIRHFYRVNGRTCFTTEFHGSVFYHWMYIMLCFLCCIYIVLYWSKKIMRKSQRKYVAYIILGNTIMLLSAIPDTVLPFYGIKSYPSSVYGVTVSFLMTVFFSIRYDTFGISKLTVSDYLFNQIDYGVMVYDYQRTHILHNTNAEVLFGADVEQPFEELVACGGKKEEFAEQLYQGKLEHCKVKCLQGNQILSVTSSMVCDEYGEMQNTIVTLVDITYEEELLERLRVSDRAKTDFLTNMSHEIRTPINGIMGMNSILLRQIDMLPREKIAEYAGNMQRASRTLLAIVNDILDISKIESGKMEMLAMVDEDEFVGLAINLIDAEQDRALLDYYAIVPEKRNYGYGSRGLEALLKKFKNHKYIFEIETQDEKAENAEERKKRKAFYLRNGLQETGLFVNVYDTDFEILTPDGELTFWEYVDFLREVMYEEYVQILRPTLIAMKK